MIEALAAVAPGTSVREGLDRILHARMGAFIVMGDGEDVLARCSGGFELDTEFSPQRLCELAKMDGAIVLGHSGRIARVNVHMVPDRTVATDETGTRHRSAERLARSVDVPVIAVSEDRSSMTVYRHNEKHELQPVPDLIARANQALQTLERYRQRLDAVTGALTALEMADLATLRDVANVLQRTEMVRRIAEEIDSYVVELGDEGRLVLLQLEEMMAGVVDDRRLVVRDYIEADNAMPTVDAVRRLAQLSTEDLLSLDMIARVLRHDTELIGLDTPLQPRGYRLLTRVPRIGELVIEVLVEHFGNLQAILEAGQGEIELVEGIGPSGAPAIHEGLARLSDAGLVDRHL